LNGRQPLAPRPFSPIERDRKMLRLVALPWLAATLEWKNVAAHVLT